MIYKAAYKQSHESSQDIVTVGRATCRTRDEVVDVVATWQRDPSIYGIIVLGLENGFVKIAKRFSGHGIGSYRRSNQRPNLEVEGKPADDEDVEFCLSA